MVDARSNVHAAANHIAGEALRNLDLSSVSNASWSSKWTAASTTGALRRGHGTGALSWGPIMGASYGRNVSQWSRGQYYRATNAEDDLAIEREGVTLLCDPLSLQYLTGAQIDYAENLSGAQFVISNPNAKTTCGCGSSFSA